MEGSQLKSPSIQGPQHDVLRFDVQVDDAIRVDVGHSAKELVCRGIAQGEGFRTSGFGGLRF